MEQLKYSLGPFELFAAIIGGSPFVLAGFLIYHPVASLAELVEVIQENGSGDGAFAIALTLLLVSYIIGGTIQGLSGGISFEFEDRLVLQLRQTIGIPKKLNWMDSRLKAYLRERNSPSVAAADTLVASHIMFRNLSLGCLILCAVSIANSVRLRALEPLLLSPFVGYVAYLMFRRSVSFKKWQNRTLILGFYFAATQSSASEGHP